MSQFNYELFSAERNQRRTRPKPQTHNEGTKLKWPAPAGINKLHASQVLFSLSDRLSNYIPSGLLLFFVFVCIFGLEKRQNQKNEYGGPHVNWAFAENTIHRSRG